MPARLVVDPLAPDPRAIRRAAEALRRGELVAFPTETVYGLGAIATEPRFVERIFRAKGRPPTNPLIVHVGGMEEARALAASTTTAAERLAERFWPGPLTIVLPKRPEVPDIVTAGGPTVALRSPAHPVAQALIEAVGAPIAAPSANRSTWISPTSADHVIASLGDEVAIVLDGGTTEHGIESTVVDATVDPPVVLRPGSISREEIAEALGVRIERAAASGGIARSPGQVTRHYAPKARLHVVRPEAVAGTASRIAASRAHVFVIAIEPGRGDVVLPADPKKYAAALYAALHLADERADAIVLASPPEAIAWEAVHDRLKRAAAKDDVR